MIRAALDFLARCGILLAATFAFAWAISIAERAA